MIDRNSFRRTMKYKEEEEEDESTKCLERSDG